MRDIETLVADARMVETMQAFSCGEECCGLALQHAEDRDAVLDLFDGIEPVTIFQHGLEGEEVILVYLDEDDRGLDLPVARLTMWA